MKSTKLYYILLFFLITSCTNNESQKAQLTIQFNKNQFLTQGSGYLPQQSAANPDADWGLPDPTSLTQIQCYGVFVGGVEAEFKKSYCTNENNNKFYFGPRAGFFSMDKATEMEIVKGLNRTIYIVGMSSADGTCESDFDIDPEINSSNYSNPFIIGVATANLTELKNTVRIPISNSFTNANKIKDCDFFKGTSDNRSLSLTFPTSKRTYWLDDEISKRTVTFSHNGTSVRCSNDGGANYGSCSTGQSLIWSVADYSNEHKIEVTYADGSKKNESFIPSTKYSGLNFIPVASCMTFNGAYTFAAVATQFSTNSSIICLGNGTTISQNYTNLAVGEDVTIIVREGEVATITNLNTSDNSLSITNRSQFKAIGVTIESYSSGGAFSTVNVIDTSNAFFEDVEIKALSSSGIALRLSSSTPNTVTLKESIVRADVPSGKAISVSNVNSTVYVENNSHISSLAFGVSIFSSGNVFVRDSTIEALGSSSYSAYMYGNSNMTIENSKIIDHSGYGLFVNGNVFPDTAFLTLNSNRFIRAADNGGIMQSALNLTSSTGFNQINSVNNDNLFCNAVTGIAIFSSIQNIAPDTGTFNHTLNNGGMAISQCL